MVRCRAKFCWRWLLNSYTQLANLQFINKILAVTAQIVNGRVIQCLLSAISRDQALLAFHRNTLRNLVVGRKRKREMYKLALFLRTLRKQPRFGEKGFSVTLDRT